MVLEVGPGTGNMTVKLLEKAKKVKRGFNFWYQKWLWSKLRWFTNMDLFELIAIILTVILAPLL